MTLVVARKMGNRLFIESDSRITDRSKVQDNPLCGVLKAVLVSPTVCICFAGNVYFAEDALKTVIGQGMVDPVEIQAVLASSIKESGGSVEYLLAFLETDSPVLIKLSEGVEPVRTTTAWIGNKAAFEAFQKAMNQYDDSADPNLLRMAFREVMDDTSIDDVGGFQISLYVNDTIYGRSRGFAYKESMEGSTSEVQHVPAGQTVTLSFGTAAGGACQIAYLVSRSEHRLGVAIYFQHGEFGVLFSPQVSFNGKILHASDGNDFAQQVLDQYDIPLYGVYHNGQLFQVIDTRPGRF